MQHNTINIANCVVYSYSVWFYTK